MWAGSLRLRAVCTESRANALWGAPRIHGKLLKLGFEVAPSTVKDAPLHRAIERLGAVISRPVLGGLHHQYCRI